MSKIFLPYIYHGSVAHKYYISFDYKLNNSKSKKKFSTIFSTGTREDHEGEFQTSYIYLLDKLLIYDIMYLPVEDLVYLVGSLGFDDTIKIINSGAIKFYDALSNRIGMFFDPFGQPILFNDVKPLNDVNWKDRLDSIIKPLRYKLYIKEEWKSELTKIIRNSYFINDLDTLFNDTRSEVLFEYGKPDIKELLKLSPKVISKNTDEDQVKTNRLLHFHYYRRVSKLLNCDYMFVPVELEGLYNHYLDNVYSRKEALGNIFQSIIEFEDIPDIPKLYDEDLLNVDDILSIRNTRASRKFRKWISKVSKNQDLSADVNRLIKYYHNACMTNNKFMNIYNSQKGAAMRTIGLLSLGTANAGLGAGVTAIDYLISNNLNNYKPSDFTRDKLRKKINQNKKVK